MKLEQLNIIGEFESSIETRSDDSNWNCFWGHIYLGDKKLFITACDIDLNAHFKILTNKKHLSLSEIASIEQKLNEMFRDIKK